MTYNFQQWMSRLPQRWRTQRNAIRNTNCKTSWIIKILNAHCAPRNCLGAYLSECSWTPLNTDNCYLFQDCWLLMLDYVAAAAPASGLSLSCNEICNKIYRWWSVLWLTTIYYLSLWSDALCCLHKASSVNELFLNSPLWTCPCNDDRCAVCWPLSLHPNLRLSKITRWI